MTNAPYLLDELPQAEAFNKRMALWQANGYLLPRKNILVQLLLPQCMAKLKCL